MPYQADDTAIETGEIVELFRFESDVLTYRYTSYTEDVTTQTSEVFESIEIKRDKIKNVAHTEFPKFKIQCPIDIQLVNDFSFQVSNRNLRCTVLRQHTQTGDQTVLWQGPVTSIAIKDNVATITVPSFFAQMLNEQMPNVTYQPVCNHNLFDARCAVDPAPFTFTGTIVARNSGTEYQLSNTNGEVDDYFKSGVITRNSDGEKRMITEQIGNVIKINYPFRVLNVNDAYTITAGCTHKRTGPGGCINKFNNLANYGGEDFIPSKNIFESGIR